MRRLHVILVILCCACATDERPRELANNITTHETPEPARSDARSAAAPDLGDVAVPEPGGEPAKLSPAEAVPPTPGPDAPPVLATLTPYFITPPLSDAQASAPDETDEADEADQADGRATAAAALEAFAAATADTDARALPALFRAAWLLGDDDRERAAALFERVAHAWPLMADIAFLRAAELRAAAADGADDDAAALALLDRMPRDSIHRGQALALRTKLLAKTPDGRGAARTALEEAAMRNPGQLLAESWQELIALRSGARDAEGAARARLELAVRFAGDASGREALKDLAVRELSPRERLRLGEALFDAYRYTAMNGVIGTLNAPKDVACDAWILLGRAAERKKKHDARALEKAFAYYQKALSCSGEARAWATFLGGRARLESKPKEGRKLLKAHADEFPDRSTADDALLLLAETDKRPKSAVKTLLSTLRRYPQGDMADAVAWDIVGPHVEARRWKKVLEATDQVLEIAPDDVPGRHPGRYRYWRARALWELDRKDEARGEWRRVFNAHPFSWYAVLALSRLSADGGVDELVPRPGDPTGPPDLRVPAALWADVHFRRAVEWARLAKSELDRPSPFVDMIDRELDEVAEDARPSGEAWTWTRVEVQQLGGGYPRSMRLARRVEADEALPFPVGWAATPWRLAYPRPYIQYVTHWATERALDPFWIWAVMRVESNFDPEAVSWANAIGLMQIILPTAKYLARDTEHKPTRENLMRPEVAVELGTKFLQSLLERHKILPLASAGYNAGGGAVAKWRREFGDLEVDEFVERIPYREAHLYTKSVTQTWARYRWLYGGELATIDLTPVGPPDAD